MKYLPPLNGDVGNPNRGWPNANPNLGIEGAIPPGESWEHPLRELDSFVSKTGQTPSLSDLLQITKGVRSQALNYRVAGGTANALTVTLDPALTAHVEGMPLRIKITTTNTGAATLDVGPGALPIKTLRGDGLSDGDLPAGAVMTVIGVTGAWMLAGVAYSDFRRILRSSINFYVAPGGSDSNSGQSVGQPWATLQKAWNTIRDHFDVNGKFVTVNVAAGSLAAGLEARGTVLGADGGAVRFLGDPTTPANVTVAPTTTSAFFAGSGAQYSIDGFNIRGQGASIGSNQGCGILCQSGNITFSNTRFSASDIAHVYAQNGVAQMLGDCSIVGPAVAAFWAAGYGTIEMSGHTITITGTPAFTQFARAITGIISAAGTTFTGSATGQRYSSLESASIKTSGGGANYFPGNAAGFTDSTSSYS